MQELKRFRKSIDKPSRSKLGEIQAKWDKANIMLTVYENENKSNGITITSKRSEKANYPHISIY